LAKIEIDGVHFGSLPGITETGLSYTVYNKEGITGNSIKVITTRDEVL